MPANVFETHAGHFWGIHETRPYMRARYALVEALLKVKTYAAVAAAHAHLMDMLRLCRGDNMGVRSAVPALYLRLGREQECYDFCVWYATEGQKGDYDWGDMELPYLDVKGADVLGLQEELLHKYADLNHSIAVVLLKIRLHSVVWSLWESYLLADKVPRDILLAIQDHILSGSVLAHRKELVGRDTQAAILETLRDQIKSLYNAVQKQNQYFWPALLKPGKHLTARPEYTSSGTIQEMELVLSYNYDAWMETPGALDMVRRLNGKNSDM